MLFPFWLLRNRILTKFHFLLNRTSTNKKRTSWAWTATTPKMKNTNVQSMRTFPNIGSVSKSNMTRIRIDGTRLMARKGLSTRIVRIAVKFILSRWRQYSNAPAITMKQSFCVEWKKLAPYWFGNYSGKHTFQYSDFPLTHFQSTILVHRLNFI